MQVAIPRLIVSIGAALVLLAGTVVPVVGAEAAVAKETDCIAEVEPNDVAAEGTAFIGEGCVTGTLVEVGDVDVFRWEVEEVDAETTWTLELEGVQDTTTTLVLGDGDEADTDTVQLDAVAGQEQASTDVVVDAGTYTLLVRREEPIAGTEITEADYVVRLARADVPESSAPPAAGSDMGSIRVVVEPGVTPELGAGVAVELVLDTSGSMLERLGKNTKLEIAERTLIDIVDELPAGTPVALRTFKAQPRSCATVLRVPLEPLRRKAMKQTIADLPSRKGTRTPLAKAIKQVPRDLKGFEGHRVVVVVTDGKEDCDGDPAAAVAGLSDAGDTTTVHLIGYALPEAEALRAELAELAAIGGGRFLEASDRASLTAALEAAVSAPYLVVDESGALVAQGLAGDDGVGIEAGVYDVEILGDPPTSFEAIEVEAGAEVELPLAPPDTSAD
jgi:hypothetical protein